MKRSVVLYTAMCGAAITFAGMNAAFALSLEQARESCRNTVGRPIVQACMAGQGKAADAEQRREACRAQASPKVKACVLAALNTANGRANVPIALHKDGKPPSDNVAPGNALPAGFVAPPRTIADITAILESEKPDPATLAKLREDADDEPEKNASQSDLADFYLDRGTARALLGRNYEALGDGEKALAAARSSGDAYFSQRIRIFIGQQKMALGDIKGALQISQFMVKDADRPGQKGYRFLALRSSGQILVQLGDILQAEGYLRSSLALIQEARTSGHPGWRTSYSQKGRNWEGEVESLRATIFETRGQFREAEAAYAKAREWKLASIPDFKNQQHVPPESQFRLAADTDLLNVARMKAKQGRLAEAEVDARKALLGRLRDQGKFNPLTTRFVLGLASILVDEGRYSEAEKLTVTALDIQRTLKIGDDTQFSGQILSQLGAVLTLQRKLPEAAAVYAQLDKAIEKWEPRRREVLELNGSRIDALFASGQIEVGLAAAQALLKREIARIGEKHFDTASARGVLAVGYMKAGRAADAVREFKVAIPVLLAASRENSDDDDSTVVVGRSERLRGIVEAYIQLLASASAASSDVAVETFNLADSIRSQSVQKALSASSARASIKDPALAGLVRKEQDLSKQVNAQLGLLTNILSLPSGDRDEKSVKGVNASIAKLRTDRDNALLDINKRFPSYADLVDPKPPSVDQIKATLASGEAMLSFYFGRDAGFVWAVPKNGPVAFAVIPMTSGELESKVRKLREALEPQAAMISDIPAFDLKLGYELYASLLKPVESGWKQSKSLIVVTNGALGLLPLSLLPVASAEIKADDDPLFASYRNVPWLARTHAVTMVPSAAALRTLRQLPPGKPSRSELIAFGDPYFSKLQEVEAAQADRKVQLADVGAGAVTTRGLPLKRRNSPKLEGVDSAELAMLPRLPDTAEELRSIALALQADPAKVLNLGKDANEKTVKTMDLSGFKILAFATHGLVPGELNGLTQPALALSAPDVSGAEGDGLLSMEEILTLKLDADWVVLSACNTGAGAGAGAEAASGLGRAFFYAGTRALLVTNWSVHSQSARELVTDLFKRQADDVKLTRGEALQQAMMALADGPGYLGSDGKTEFTYAHPLFWAPYSIVGDGGTR
ncbi:CHAT domain-containing protein [Afipia massiliensis]|uniref:CHAT domain-containing protein n=1 Tax=Afipia massiliensis TaxID=211460 RepID=A0A840N413_9BRAD|nr:CHAT domain-containing protein [Afipia massiliensis]MBB5055085.1 CHAT domain-containing protein [Afipia massiliensis]